jgi:hypothetical protein
VSANPWEDDDSDVPDDNLVLAQLATLLVPAVPVVEMKGEAYKAFMGEYTSVCQAVDQVHNHVRQIVGHHFANLRTELLQRLDQKSINSISTNGISSFRQQKLFLCANEKRPGAITVKKKRERR